MAWIRDLSQASVLGCPLTSCTPNKENNACRGLLSLEQMELRNILLPVFRPGYKILFCVGRGYTPDHFSSFILRARCRVFLLHFHSIFPRLGIRSFALVALYKKNNGSNSLFIKERRERFALVVLLKRAICSYKRLIRSF